MRSSGVPARRDVRPPFASGSAPPSGAPRAPRPTVNRRSEIRPQPWLGPGAFDGYLPDDPYVRRYWTAIIGPGAVADLLRLTVAAVRGSSLLRPTHMDLLAREGLVAACGDKILVRPTVPKLTPDHHRRLPPALRLELEG